MSNHSDIIITLQEMRSDLLIELREVSDFAQQKKIKKVYELLEKTIKKITEIMEE